MEERLLQRFAFVGDVKSEGEMRFLICRRTFPSTLPQRTAAVVVDWVAAKLCGSAPLLLLL